MAINNKQVLGRPTGRVGDVVYRRVNGKIVISEYVANIEISKSKNCVHNRTRFGVCTAFAVAASSIIPINMIWKNSSALGRSAYTKLIKANIKLVDDKKPTPLTSITPHDGLALSLINVVINNSSIDVEYKIDRSSTPGLTAPYTCSLLAYCFDKRTENIEIDDDYFSITTRVTSETNNNTQSVSFNINDYTKGCIRIFQKARIYLAVTKFSTDPLKPEWSTTGYKEINLPTM
ncbi:MAG: hypothetical protein WC139_00335 [Candidatus Kapaibacterium sp.]